LKKWVDTYGTSKPVCGTFARRLRADAFYLHADILIVWMNREFQTDPLDRVAG
jgi:hypothetical protein